jgi:PAS domain S-box-containing protein
MPDAHDQRLLTLVGCIHGIVLEFDADARYRNAWADDPALLARPPEDMVGKTIDEVLGPAVGAPFTAMVHRVYATGVVEHLEYPIDLDSGRRWFFADIKRVGTGDGMTVVFFARDITERKVTEEALARSEERYRLAAQATNDLLWDWDIAAGTVTWNIALTTMLGYTERDNAPDWWRERLHPDERDRVVRRLDATLGSRRRSWSDRYRFRRADGSYGEFIDRGLITRDAAGHAVRVVGSMTDVTQITRMQAQLLQADRLAAIGTLAAGVGHEINNPLTYVLGNLELALDMTGDDDELTQTLQEAREGALRIAEIVKSLKTFTRSDDGELRPVEVDRVLDAAIKMADQQIRPRARLVRSFERVPQVHASEGQLAQVALNLLINAAQAIPEGNADGNEIHVTLRMADRGRVAIAIRDTGVGIAPQDVPRLFDPFFTTKDVGGGGGTGLGLSICHDIVQKLGGDITVTSCVGEGTTFTVLLPAVAVTSEGLPRVLVIDDEVQICRYVSRIFRSGADVVALTSAREGLARLMSPERFDLVLCDVMMPDMTGIDLYEELRAKNPSLLRRVYFMTGGAFTPRAQAFLDTIGAARIDKPLDRKHLMSLLAALH